MATEVYAKYEYVCGSGHSMGSERAMDRCPVATCKQPQLKRVGHNSRKDKAGAA